MTGGNCRHGEEGAGFVEGGLEGSGTDAEADEIEQVAVLAGGGVAPLAGDAGRDECRETKVTPNLD